MNVKKYQCSTCGKLIKNGMGFLQVNSKDICEFDKAATPPLDLCEADYGFPSKWVPVVKWYAVHTHCEVFGADYHRIPVANLRYPEGIIEETAHLLELGWIGKTNWAEILQAFADSPPKATFYQERPHWITKWTGRRFADD